MTWSLLMLPIATAAFLALSAAMPRHQPVLFGRRLSVREGRRARLGGWILLTTSFGMALVLFGIGRGLLVFAGYATLGAGIVVGLQCWRGRQARIG